MDGSGDVEESKTRLSCATLAGPAGGAPDDGSAWEAAGARDTVAAGSRCDRDRHWLGRSHRLHDARWCCGAARHRPREPPNHDDNDASGHTLDGGAVGCNATAGPEGRGRTPG